MGTIAKIEYIKNFDRNPAIMSIVKVTAHIVIAAPKSGWNKIGKKKKPRTINLGK